MSRKPGILVARGSSCEEPSETSMHLQMRVAKGYVHNWSPGAGEIVAQLELSLNTLGRRFESYWAWA